MKHIASTLLVWLAACLLWQPSTAKGADYDNSPTIGPAKGWLIIEGGGGLPAETKNLFVALAGGRDANFVVIPTAMSDAEMKLKAQSATEIDFNKLRQVYLTEFGLTHVVVLHTRDRVRANSEGFIEPLRHASGVWIDGGRQWRLTDAYLGTAVEREIKALLARGGVVGGGSAGATIQGSYLVRGDPAGNSIMMAAGHETGFVLLGDSAIDQHVNTRGREKDLDPVIAAHPSLLGIGIDEETAIVVHGDFFKVIGPGQVAIHDGKEHDGALYYFLSSGQTFNLKTRAVANPADSLSLTRNALPSAGSIPQVSKYPLMLTVTSAQRYYKNNWLMTNGAGVLTSKSDPAMRQRIILQCDVGVYSRAGSNVYPARIDKPGQLKIEFREIGSDKTKEGTCKY